MTIDGLIDGVIFDNDGTLVDSERVAAGLLQRMLADRDIDLDRDEVLRRFRGVQFAAFVAELKQEHPHLDAEPFMQAFREDSLALFRQQMDEMPGAGEFLRGLDLPKCVASNGPRDKIETTLRSAGLLELFGANIASAYEVGSWKPEPGLILAAAQLLGLDPSRCLLVDDSVQGVQAGFAAGAQVAGYGETDFSEFEGRPGFHRVEDYEALQALVARLRRS